MKSPICVFLGHVDAGKTSIMDAIRNTYYAYKETGGLTQNIGITEIPTSRINELSADLLKKFNVNVNIPSILFIDSPGHEAFVTLRQRGASIADLAILTVDVTEGIQQQTIESIEILKSYKTPFLVALTKIDTIKGFSSKSGASFLDFFASQGTPYKESLEKEMYDLIAELSNYSFQAERYDRVKDFTKEVAIIPVSAINNIGIKDLLVFIIGISQRYLSLSSTEGDIAAMLEEKNVKGMGKVYDAVVYSGKLKVGDDVVVSTLDGPKDASIRAIMRLASMAESREKFGEYESVKSIEASAPMRLVLSGAEPLVGTSISAFHNKKEKEKILSDLKESTAGYNDESAEGVIVCADSLGSIEAMKKIGTAAGIKIGMTKIGEPMKREIMLARLRGKAILCFNVPVSRQKEAEIEGVKLISSASIYDIFEKYKEFTSEANKRLIELKSESTRLPGKLKFLKGNVFRRSGPCVFGVEVLLGEFRPGYPLMNEHCSHIGKIIDVQQEKKKLTKVVKGERAAISVDDAVFGRNIYEDDILYTDMSIEDIMRFEDLSPMLPEDYREALGEIRKLKRL